MMIVQLTQFWLHLKLVSGGPMRKTIQEGKFASTIWKHWGIQPHEGYLFKTLSTHKYISLFWLCNSIYITEASSLSFLYFVDFQIKYK